METWPAASVPRLPGTGPRAAIFDTARREFAVAAEGAVATIYACGITPYDATHIGHAATYIAWDLLVRAWRDNGLDVLYAQNVTDVDDPLLERAERDGDDWRELALRETDRYRADMTALRVLPPDHLIGAVEALDVIGEFSGLLAERGALYEISGDRYLSRAADPAFGSVSGLGQAEMIGLFAERGGDPDRSGKKDPLDALVWRAKRPGEPSWESRFGPGRPGWHVECSAIATKYLGISFDVQAGGSDLIFPHHEMSASHARVAYGGESGAAGAGREVFARRYAHAGMVALGGEKMSKSLGNLVFVSRLRDAGTDPMAIRLAILAHHYRSDWEWSAEGLAAAERRLERWRTACHVAGRGGASWFAGVPDVAGVAGGGAAEAGAAPEAGAAARAVLAGVRERIADDLDAPGALAVIDRWADGVLAADGAAGVSGASAASGVGLVAAVADALLGIAL